MPTAPAADRRSCALGLPVLWRGGDSTAAFSFRYEGDRRVDGRRRARRSLGPADLYGLERADWVHVGALARSDFPPRHWPSWRRDRRVSFDGQGLVRPERTGPLRARRRAYDPEVLRHVSILKLAEEEARCSSASRTRSALRSLGVPEVVVTLGSEGSLVLADGKLEQVPAHGRRARSIPTGAGDAFSAAYLASRSAGTPRRPRRGGRPRSWPACWRAGSREGARPHGRRRLRGRPRGGGSARLRREARSGRSGSRSRCRSSSPVQPLGSTVVAVVDRRPPLVVSNDAGRTWREAGGGLPPGRAVAIADDDPDLVLYAARNRLYLSEDGGASGGPSSSSCPRSEPSPSREIQ